MNLSFFPADLHLKQAEEKEVFLVVFQGQEILNTRSRRAALAKFKSLRDQLEKKFPLREPTPQEKMELLKREIRDSLVGHNSLGGRKKKSTARGTRTFGS